MTIQWVLIAAFLYLELVVILLLILPFISPNIWKCMFHFHIWKALGKKVNMYLTVFLIVLVLFFLDSIREMIKYSGEHRHDYEAELQVHMKLFRSQRNYYIVGFAIFLCLVIRRLSMLILTEAELLTRNEEAMKSAQETTEKCEKLSKEVNELDTVMPKSVSNQHCLKEIENLNNELINKNQELLLFKQRLESIKDRSKEVSKEYDNLKAQVDLLKGSLTTPSVSEVD